MVSGSVVIQQPSRLLPKKAPPKHPQSTPKTPRQPLVCPACHQGHPLSEVIIQFEGHEPRLHEEGR